MGSGSLCAMAVFESRYKENMSEEEAVDLVDDAIQAGIFNDLGSGGNVDICVIKAANTVKYMRTHQAPNERLYRRQKGYVFPRGSTVVLSETKQVFAKPAEAPVAAPVAAAAVGAMSD
jgi:20S proteasome subunit beta 2